MRVVVISASAQRSAPSECVKKIASGIESAGHQVEILDAWADDGHKLPSYEYVVCVAEQTSLFGGKMPDALARILAASSGIGGKRAAAFLRKTWPFTSKGLANLMRAMEHEGLMVNWSDIILSPAHAYELGKRIS